MLQRDYLSEIKCTWIKILLHIIRNRTCSFLWRVVILAVYLTCLCSFWCLLVQLMHECLPKDFMSLQMLKSNCLPSQTVAH